MLTTLKPFDRYQRINNIFNTRKGGVAVVTTKELVGHLGISVRQLRIDMQKMREMGAPLEYIARERGWRYTRAFDFSGSIPLSAEDILQLRLAVATLAQINHIPEFKKLPDLFEKIRQSVRRWLSSEATAKAIYFDPLPEYEGAKYLPFFLKAIEETRQIKFDYQSFYAHRPKTCVVDPYFLRQHNQLWYVGGLSHARQEGFIRTFPLDRIIGTPQFTSNFFERPENFDPPDYWKNIVGINRPPSGKVETVVLEFTNVSGKYFLSKPFYEPFKIIKNSPGNLVIELELMIEIELVQKIVSLGSDVIILGPERLIEETKSFLSETLEKYL